MARRRVDPAEAAEQLRAVLDAVASGELTAPLRVLVRLEGALMALDALTADRQRHPHTWGD